MIHSYFGLHHPPFSNTPDIQRFYPGGHRGDTLQALMVALDSGAAITKVIGEVGSGKTMLCRMLQAQSPPHWQTMYILNPRFPPADLYRVMAGELGLATAETDTLSLRHLIYHYLLEQHHRHQRVMLVVDEAQCVPPATLEEMRLLTNLETHTSKLLQILLFGQPELDNVLSDPGIRQFRERIQYSFNLTPLTTAQLIQYLGFRLRLAGHEGPPIFSAAACRRLARYSQGLMRRVNILADKSLLAAYCDGSRRIQKRHVVQAFLDSEFIACRRRRWMPRFLSRSKAPV